MPWSNSLGFQVATCIPGQFNDFGRNILENGGHVDTGNFANLLAVVVAYEI
jgi:hypothetical protein